MDCYPRPQFVRNKWRNLNGLWSFAFDDKEEGIRNQWFKDHSYQETIKVPYVYQSVESGINTQEIHDCIWYSKEWTLDDFSEKILRLHFGASDYYTRVWINGEFCGSHSGGHSPFSFDIERYVKADRKLKIDICVADSSKDTCLPRGKQNFTGKSEGIFYTSSTGIWQTVWLEYLNDVHLESVNYLPDTLKNQVTIAAKISNASQKKIQLQTRIYRKDELVADNLAQIISSETKITFEIPDFNDHHYGYWWHPDQPNLYDVTFSVLVEGQEADTVQSYFGMRDISIEAQQFCINHLPFYTKSVLYQGYYPDSLLTAKSDDEIRRDVQLIKDMGFNSVRLHQKYENPRFLYWCDCLGLLVWAEAPNAYSFSFSSVERFTKEWIEIMKRDFNHPSIGVWVPLNESWGVPKIKNVKEQQAFSVAMSALTKSLDSSRPVISNDGWEHTISDLCTIHDYEANLTVLKNRYDSLEEMLKGPQNRAIYVDGYHYNDEPVILSEFGGIAYDSSNYGKNSWGYSGAENQGEFEAKVLAIISQVQESSILQGYCYTQFNDLEQEVNGLVTMERQPKVSIEKMKRINCRK